MIPRKDMIITFKHSKNYLGIRIMLFGDAPKDKLGFIDSGK